MHTPGDAPQRDGLPPPAPTPAGDAPSGPSGAPVPPGVSVDEELGTVSWHAPARSLVWRGLAFLGGALAAAALLAAVDSRPAWALVVAVAVTAGPAAWLVRGLRHGWELEEWGMTIGTGTRHPERLLWQEVDHVEVVEQRRRGGAGWDAEVHLRDGRVRRLTPAAPGPSRFEAAFAVADAMDLLPGRITVTRRPVSGTGAETRRDGSDSGNMI